MGRTAGDLTAVSRHQRHSMVRERREGGMGKEKRKEKGGEEGKSGRARV
jgi:hypothetical protein